MQKIKKFLFHNTSVKQTMAKNTFWLVASEIVGRLLKMGLIVYAARILGTAGWGVFSYAISIGGLLMLFSDIGLGGLITRETIQKKENYRTFIATTLFIKIVLLIISSLLIIFLAPEVSHIPEARVLFPLIAVIMFFDSIRETGFALNRSYETMEWEMIVKTIMNGLILVVGIVLIRHSGTPLSITIAYAIGSAIGALAIIIILKKHLREFWVKIDTKSIKNILQITWPFAFITLIGTIMGNTDIYMLGIWKSSDEIGLYTSVQRIQQFILIIPSMIATASFPIISRLAHTDKKQFAIALEKTISMSMLVCIPITFGGIMLSNTVVPFIFGAGYVGAIPIMQILMIMLIPSFPLIAISNAIFSYNKQRSLAPIYITGVIVNIILNYLLIPSFGATGSAVATLISTTAITVLAWNVIRREHTISIFPYVKKILIATILMILVIFILQLTHLNIIGIITIASLIYLLMLLLLKEPLLKEIKNLWH